MYSKWVLFLMDSFCASFGLGSGGFALTIWYLKAYIYLTSNEPQKYVELLLRVEWSSSLESVSQLVGPDFKFEDTRERIQLHVGLISHIGSCRQTPLHHHECFPQIVKNNQPNEPVYFPGQILKKLLGFSTHVEVHHCVPHNNLHKKHEKLGLSHFPRNEINCSQDPKRCQKSSSLCIENDAHVYKGLICKP